jgi:hypothetical protein
MDPLRQVYSFQSAPTLLKQISDLVNDCDCLPCPFGTNPRLVLAPAAILSFPLRSATAAIVASHFVSKSSRRRIETEADLGHKVYAFASAVAKAGFGWCITQSFNSDEAVRVSAKVHSLGFECPVVIAVGKVEDNMGFLRRVLNWWLDDGYRVPMKRILLVDENGIPAKVLKAIEAVRECFSVGNAQNWRIGWDGSGVLFYAESDLDVSYVNGGIAMAAFEAAAKGNGIKGGFLVEEAHARIGDGYLVSFKVDGSM